MDWVSLSNITRELAARMADLLGRAERSSPEAAQRRAAGAGLDGERAHRAIIVVPRCARLLGAALSERRRTLERQFAGISSSDASGRDRLERRLLCASR